MKRLLLLCVFVFALLAQSQPANSTQTPLIIETIFSADRASVSLKITNGLPFTIKVPSATLWNIQWEAWSFKNNGSNFELSTILSREFIINGSEPSPEQKLSLLLKKINASNSWIVLNPNESIALPLIPPVEVAKDKIGNETDKIDIVYRARVDNILIDSDHYDYNKQLASMLMTHKTTRFWFKEGGWLKWGHVANVR